MTLLSFLCSIAVENVVMAVAGAGKNFQFALVNGSLIVDASTQRYLVESRRQL